MRGWTSRRRNLLLVKRLEEADMANDKSPAVEALEAEQARQRSINPLDEGLKETFPASDPVSAATRTMPSDGHREASSSDAPLVDEALGSILEHRDDPYVEPREQLAALKDEAESLRYRAAEDVRSRIRGNPWQAVGLAAVVGFIVGITH
jgi:ElaB/YqjD/DUF883 family membrane-anchored ribosome-binding protein